LFSADGVLQASFVSFKVRLHRVMTGPQHPHHVELSVGKLRAQGVHLIVVPGELHGHLNTTGGDWLQFAGCDAGDQENQNGDLHSVFHRVHAQSASQTG